MGETYTFVALLWLWTSDKAPASWHFLTIDGDTGDAIKATSIMRRLESGRTRGFGSIKVTVAIGSTTWNTSIFPSKELNGWLLPIKATIRKAERLVAGDTVAVAITLV